jgi:hypothetical protein
MKKLSHTIPYPRQDDLKEKQRPHDSFLDLKMVFSPDGRCLLIESSGMVNVALRELGAKIVDVEIIKSGVGVRYPSKN